MSRSLYPEEFKFNFYTGQIETVHDNGKSYGTVITIKETSFLRAAVLMELLNTNYEIVISEAIDFSRGNRRLPKYRYQKYINSLSDDRQFVELMGGAHETPQTEDFRRASAKHLHLAQNSEGAGFGCG